MPQVAASLEHFLSEFISRYGRDALRQLVTALRNNATTDEIAFRYGVDKRTARLWRERLGCHVKVFIPHPAVEKAVEEKSDASAPS